MNNKDRIKHLRFVAKDNGWNTRKVTAAPTKHRAAIELVCTRVERPAWDPTSPVLSHKVAQQTIEVHLDSFSDALYGLRFGQSHQLTIGEIYEILGRPTHCPPDHPAWGGPPKVGN